MYTNCMFCQASLGRNEVVEHFPVGRRLAFDAARGRLWVVCRKCERWNLTPIEERWEAVESCERLFRGTRARVSSENVGLARLTEGLELVRIGEPLRPEFAAWRYGDQFGRRRRRAIVQGATAAVVGAGIVFAGIASGAAGALLLQAGHLPDIIRNSQMAARLRTDDGRLLKVSLKRLQKTRVRLDDDGAVRLHVNLPWGREEVFDGEEARRFAAIIVPKINLNGGTKRTVQQAVSQLERFGASGGFLSYIAQGDRFGFDFKHGHIARMPASTRLALEMALHEDQERRALEGELWLLERAWREAEEIAAIADDLLLPANAADFVARNRPEDA